MGGIGDTVLIRRHQVWPHNTQAIIMKKTQGFSLIELMMSIAIVGILVLVGLPTYHQSVLRSRRADAQISLNRLATLQEQYYFRTNQYAADFADIINDASSGDTVDSNEGYYSITVTRTHEGNGWSMTALAQHEQVDDAACRTLTLTHLGIEAATSADGSANSEECWR